MLLVHFPELPGSAASFRLEHAVEIGEIVEAAFITDFGYVPGGVNQHSGGESEPDVSYVI